MLGEQSKLEPSQSSTLCEIVIKIHVHSIGYGILHAHEDCILKLYTIGIMH